MKQHVSWKILGIIFILFCLVITYTLNQSEEMARLIISDVGIVQTINSIILFFAFLLALKQVFSSQHKLVWGEISYIIFIYACRESDFHFRFTQEHVTRMKFYKGAYPMHHKIIAATILIIFAIVALHLLLKNALVLWEKLKKREIWAVQSLFWAIALAGAQLLDKSPWKKLLSEKVVEENLECFAACILVSALITAQQNFKD